jgi:FkbM family methyltransferase
MQHNTDDTITYFTKYGKVTLYQNEIYIGSDFKNLKYWDEHNLLSLKSFIDPDKNIIEIGAHCGTTSLIYATYLNKGKIYAYEPQKNMYKLLCKNIKDNNLENKIIPFNNAIFCCKKNITMNDTDLDGGFGNVKLRYTTETDKPCNFGGLSLGVGGEYVETVVLDDLPHQNIGFIHCDAQGSEPFIMSGGKKLIERYRPVIYYEYNYNNYLHNKVCESYPDCAKTDGHFIIEDFCKSIGYTQFLTIGDRLCVP